MSREDGWLEAKKQKLERRHEGRERKIKLIIKSSYFKTWVSAEGRKTLMPAG